MNMMNVKTLKRLLEQYDDESHVKILAYSGNDKDWLDIEHVLIEYVPCDDYQVPCIILKTHSEW